MDLFLYFVNENESSCFEMNKITRHDSHLDMVPFFFLPKHGIARKAGCEVTSTVAMPLLLSEDAFSVLLGLGGATKAALGGQPR